MRMYRFFSCLGAGLAIAAIVAVLVTPGYAKEYGAAGLTVPSIDYNLAIPDFSTVAPVYNERYSAQGAQRGDDVINAARAPAPMVGAVLATAQAGWRSGRLRKLAG